MRNEHDVHVFEAEERAGGHANTVRLPTDAGDVALDSGFLVYNEVTYPGFSGLLRELDVPTQSSDMSLAVRCDVCNLEYGSSGLRAALAQPSNLLRPRRVRLVADILRFNREAKRVLAADADARSLDEFVRTGGFDHEFVHHYLRPLVASIWSMPPGDVDDFPARFLFRFLDNHQLLDLTGRLSWRTVTGGSREYVERLVAALPNGVQTGAVVSRIWRGDAGVTLSFDAGIDPRFDKVVIATHSDQALALLNRPTEIERAALSSIRYRPSRVLLHTDRSFMPKRRAAWSSWNYLGVGGHGWGDVSVTYHLNRLQALNVPTQFFISLNPTIDPRHDSVLLETTYAHPQFDARAVEAQGLIRAVNGLNHTYFAGAYLGHGFHEDGYQSGAEVAALLYGARQTDEIGSTA
jgi:predicted NAD/FAD-binding protein